MRLTSQQSVRMLGAALTPGLNLNIAPAVATTMVTQVAVSQQTNYEATLRALETRLTAMKAACGNVVPKVTVALPPSEMGTPLNSPNVTKRSTVGWRAAWATYSIPTTMQAIKCHIFPEELFSIQKDKVRALLTVQSTMNPAQWVNNVLDAISLGLYAINIQPWFIARLHEGKMPPLSGAVLPMRPSFFDPVFWSNVHGIQLGLEPILRATPVFSQMRPSYVNVDEPVASQLVSARNWATWFLSLPYQDTIRDAVLSWIACSASGANGQCSDHTIPVSPPDYAALRSQMKKLNQGLAISAALGVAQAFKGAVTGDISDLVEGTSTVTSLIANEPNLDPFQFVYVADQLFLRTPANSENSMDGSLYDTTGMYSITVGGAINNLRAAGYLSTVNQIRVAIGEIAAGVKESYVSAQSSDTAKALAQRAKAGADGKLSIPWVPIAVGGGLLLAGALLIKKLL